MSPLSRIVESPTRKEASHERHVYWFSENRNFAFETLASV
jgi:hypothetical protein